MTLSCAEPSPVPPLVSRHTSAGAAFVVVSLATSAPAFVAHLSAAERAVLSLVGQGLRDADIAERRQVGRWTVTKQIAALKRKTGHEDRLALVRLGRHAGGPADDADAPSDLGARTALRAHRAGTDVVVLRRDDAARIWEETLLGRWAFCDELQVHGRRLLALRAREGESRAPLTRRERDVAILLARGMTNKLIAWELGIAAPTVSTCAKSVLHKLGARNAAVLIDLATALGL